MSFGRMSPPLPRAHPPPKKKEQNVENYFIMIAWKEGYLKKIVSNQLH